MSKHTPGPWKYAKDDLRDGWFSIYHNGPIAYCGDTTFQDGDGEANARLIAEAPEMLRTLERIANVEVRSDRRHRNMVDIEEVERLRRIAKAAIRKATRED